MIDATWQVATRSITVTVRPQTAADAPFLRTLFSTIATIPDGLPPGMAESLLDMQCRGQVASYHAAYPNAAYSIIEAPSAPCGRLICDPGPIARIVDYALLPAFRGAGIGTAVLRAALARLEGPVHVTVLASNAACLAMCRRLGFTVLTADPAFVTLAWG